MLTRNRHLDVHLDPAVVRLYKTDRVKFWQFRTGLLPPEKRPRASGQDDPICVLDVSPDLKVRLPSHGFGGRGCPSESPSPGWENMIRAIEDCDLDSTEFH